MSTSAITEGKRLAALPRRGGERMRRDGAQALVWGVTAALVVLPLLPLIYASFRSKPFYEPGGAFSVVGYRTLLSDPAFWRAALNTLEFSATVTVLGVVAGGGMALLCERTDLPGRRVIQWLAISPILLPPLGLIQGWTTLYGDGGYLTNFITHSLKLPWDLGTPWGMGVLGAGVAAPIAMITARAALRGSDPALEDAARISGAGTMSVLARVSLPVLRPALLSSGVLIFAIALEQLGIPIFLGAPHDIDFIASYLYNTWSASSIPDPPSVSAGAVLFLIVAIGLVLFRHRLLGAEERYAGSSDLGASRPLPLGRWRWVFAAIVAAYLLITTLAPVGGVILASFVSLLTPLLSPFKLLTLDNYREVFSSPTLSQSLRNSLIVALGASVATTGLISLAMLVAHRSRFAMRQLLRFLMLFPRSVPGVIISLAFFWSFLFYVPPGQWIRNNLIGEIVALSVRGIPLAYMVMYPALTRIATSLDDAARVAGASWWQTSRRVVLPLLRPAIVASLMIIFIAVVNDYEAAVFLTKPGTQLMSVEMLRLSGRGTGGPVAALAVLQLVITAVVLVAGGACLKWMTRRGRRV